MRRLLFLLAGLALGAVLCHELSRRDAARREALARTPIGDTVVTVVTQGGERALMRLRDARRDTSVFILDAGLGE